MIYRTSPPNTPQRQRNSEREQERARRLLGSPELRRTPSRSVLEAPLQPFVLQGHPAPFPPPNPPSAPPVLDDPFGGNGAPNQNQAPVMVTVNDGGRHLQLTQGIAGRLAGEGTPPVPNAIPQQPNPMAYPNLPAALRAQMEALQPPAPQPQRRRAPANPPPPPAPLASYQGGILVLQQGAPPRATRGRPRTLPVAPPPLPLLLPPPVAPLPPAMPFPIDEPHPPNPDHDLPDDEFLMPSAINTGEDGR
ncbi:hypothetical protein DFP72DRAFT_851193 [Ephemerocybe angulata]|uniref:Uncharacterized protein n=1 Tax=Ephemerocybe angulata TaxID=980116 RepID=A0A8H6HQP7_9AGAR|nr:hypothetical protein DFP72DRAFT_851193 [Tulosesus angulatus]